MLTVVNEYYLFCQSVASLGRGGGGPGVLADRQGGVGTASGRGGRGADQQRGKGTPWPAAPLDPEAPRGGTRPEVRYAANAMAPPPPAARRAHGLDGQVPPPAAAAAAAAAARNPVAGGGCRLGGHNGAQQAAAPAQQTVAEADPEAVLCKETGHLMAQLAFLVGYEVDEDYQTDWVRFGTTV